MAAATNVYTHVDSGTQTYVGWAVNFGILNDIILAWFTLNTVATLDSLEIEVKDHTADC